MHQKTKIGNEYYAVKKNNIHLILKFVKNET